MSTYTVQCSCHPFSEIDTEGRPIAHLLPPLQLPKLNSAVICLLRPCQSVSKCEKCVYFICSQFGSVISPFVEFLCCKVLPSLSKVPQQETRQELLQLLAEGCLYPVTDDVSSKCVEPIFHVLLVRTMYMYMYVYVPSNDVMM